MGMVRRVLDAPGIELLVGLVLLASGALELRDIMLVELPGRGKLLPAAAAAIGIALVLRSLPGLFLGLELADRGLRGLTILDRLAHSRLVDLAMGVILIVAATADLVDLLVSNPTLPYCNTNTAAIVFGLVPFGDMLLAFYRGVGRIDREVPARLLDRAAHNPWLRVGAGFFLLAGGVTEFMATLAGNHALGHSLALPGGFAVVGLFAVLSGLPGVYLGLRTLADNRRKSA